MPRVQRMRIVNFPYDSHSKYIGDLMLDFNQEDSLIKLANGGGKTSLILLMALCIDPSIKIGDRSLLTYFQSYRTTTHIAVEWRLDGDNGYLLTGLTVRSNGQEVSFFTYMVNYTQMNEYDIQNLPCIKMFDGTRQLVGFHEFLAGIETCQTKSAQNSINIFQSTDYGRRKYTERLKSYAILKEEWKAMVKANVAEGGVDAIFNEQKTSGELIKKSFLPVIETVVLPESGAKGGALFDTVKAFVRNVIALPQIEKQAHCYEEFLRRGEEWQASAVAYQEAISMEETIRHKVAILVRTAEIAATEAQGLVSSLKIELDMIADRIQELNFKEASFNYQVERERVRILDEDLAALVGKLGDLAKQKDGYKRQIKALQGRQIFDEITELEFEVEKFRENLRQANLSNAETVADINAFAVCLLPLLEAALKAIEGNIIQNNTELRKCKLRLDEIKKKVLPELEQAWSEVQTQLYRISVLYDEHRRKEQILQEQLDVVVIFFDARKEMTEREIKNRQFDQAIEKLKAELKGKERCIERLIDEDRHLTDAIAEQSSTVKDAERNVSDFEASEEEARRVAGYYQTDTKDIYSGRTVTEIAYKVAEKKEVLDQGNHDLFNLNKQADLLGESSYCLPNAEVSRAVHEINKLFASIEAISGSEYLYNQPDRSSAEWYLQRYPLLPYSVIMTAEGLKRLGEEAIKAISLRYAVPVVLREILNMDKEVNTSYVYRPLDDTAFILPCETEQYLSKDVLNELRKSVQNRIAVTKQTVTNLEVALGEYSQHIQTIEGHLKRYPLGGDSLYKARDSAKATLMKKRLRQAEIRKQLDTEAQNIKNLGEEMRGVEQQQRILDSAIERLRDFLLDEERVVGEKIKIPQLENQSKDIKCKKDEVLKEEGQLSIAIQQKTSLQQILNAEKSQKESVLAQVKNSVDPIIEVSSVDISGNQSELMGRWQAAVEKLAGQNSGMRELTGVIAKDEQRLQNKRKQFDELHIPVDEISGITYSYLLVTELEAMAEQIEDEVRIKVKLQGQLEQQQVSAKTTADEIFISIKEYNKEPHIFPSIEAVVLDEIQLQLGREQEYRREVDGKTKKADGRLGEFKNTKTRIEEFAHDESIVAVTEFQLVDSAKELESILRLLKNELVRAKAHNADTRQEVENVYQSLSQDFGKEDMAHIENFFLSFAATGDGEAIYDANSITRVFGDLKLLIETNLRNWRQKREELEGEKQEIATITARYIKDMMEQIKRITNLSKATIEGRTQAMMRINNYEMTDQMIYDAVNLYVDRTIRDLEKVSDDELENKARLAFNLQRLFAAIVATERIEVEILKVREYGEAEYVPWEQLSVQNSGGEGFLSYFSVFLPLLTYIRDAMGAGARTSKVFIADNPFGKMVSPHLVRVVMDLAHRTNTQIIAFTGIGDAKIYPFFNRIYSLSLLPVSGSTKLKIEAEVTKGGRGPTKLAVIDAGYVAGVKNLF